MLPILITSPYSGANHFGENLFNLLHQWYGCRGFLHSFLNFDKNSFSTYSNGTIYHTYNYINKPSDPDHYKHYFKERIQLLLTSPNHLLTYRPTGKALINLETFKLLLDDLGYYPVYIERRNKLHQLLMHSAIKTNSKCPNIKYNNFFGGAMLGDIDRYNIIKNELPGQVVYYEDFIELGHDENAVIKLLDLDIKPFIHKDIKFNYINLTEKDIEHNGQWLSNKNKIFEELKKIG